MASSLVEIQLSLPFGAGSIHSFQPVRRQTAIGSREIGSTGS
jgi:hypothetical protein